MSNLEINVDVADPVRIIVPRACEEGQTEPTSTIEVVVPLYRFTELYMKAITALVSGNKRLCNAPNLFDNPARYGESDKAHDAAMQEEIDHVTSIARLLVHNVLINSALDSTEPFSYLPSEVKPLKIDHHSV